MQLRSIPLSTAFLAVVALLFFAAPVSTKDFETCVSESIVFDRLLQPSTPQEPRALPQIDVDSIPVKDRLIITSLDATGKIAIAGAKGYLLNPSLIPEEEKVVGRRVSEEDRIALTLKLGRTFVTGADGRWQGAKPPGQSWIYLQHQGKSGFQTHSDRSSNPCDVRLYPITTIQVLTVDHTGAPLPNTRIRILDRTRSRFASPADQSISDEEGRCVLANIGKLVPKLDQGDGYFLVPMITMSEKVMYETQWPRLSKEAIQSGQIVLRLPPMCSITLRAVDAMGRPLKEEGYININPIQELDFGWRWHPHDGVRLVDGKATISRIGTGTAFEANLVINKERARKSVKLHSPSQAGDHLAVDLKYYPTSKIVAQLIGPDGSPMANEVIEVRYGDDSNTSYVTKGMTDSNGNLLMKQRAFSGYELTRLKRLVFETRTGKPSIYRHSLPLKEGFHEGDLRLGKIQLEAANILLAGHVRDEHGHLLEGAWIHLDPIREPGSGFIRHNKSFWAITEADGSFLIEGSAPEGVSYKASVRKQHYDSIEQEVELGTNDFEFQLPAAGRLTGTIMLDPGITANDLIIMLDGKELEPNRGLRPSGSTHELRIDAPGSKGINHELLVTTQLRETVVYLKGLSMAGGQEAKLATLNPLDLRGKLKRIQFKVTDDQGQPVEARLSALGNQVRVGFRPQDNVASWVALKPISTVWVNSTGFNQVKLENVWEDQVVLMKPSLEVTVRISKGLLNAPNITPSLTVRPLPGQALPTFSPFNSEGEAILYIAEPGNYQIGLRLTRSLEGSGSASSGHHGQIYSGLDHGSTVELKLDQEWVQRFLEGR